MRALALFSGGLDSMLAAKMIMDQGIDVVLINIVSHFFGGDGNVYMAARQLGLDVHEHDFSDRHMQIVKNPRYGYGRNVNPCIDCHGLMLQCCGELLDVYDAKFVVTGEVLGQRPKSQTKDGLAKVDKLSGIGSHIVRPLSAKLLHVTTPEDLMWIDRSKLRDISGRHRDIQFQMAKDYGFTYIPSPGGGCCLTDPEYSLKLKSVLNDRMDGNIFLLRALKHGRVFQNGNGVYFIVGRNRAENAILLDTCSAGAKYVITDTPRHPGPTVLVFFDVDYMPTNHYENNLKLAKNMFAMYSSARNKDRLPLIVNGKSDDSGIMSYTADNVKDYVKHIKKARNKEFNVKFKNKMSALADPAKSRLDDASLMPLL